MPQGNHCRQSDNSSLFAKQFIIPVLLFTSWLCGWLMTRYNIPVFLQISAPLICIAILFLLCKKEEHPAVPEISDSSEIAEIPFDNSTSSSLDPDFSRQTLAKSHQYQLKSLCSALNLTSCVIILQDTAKKECSLHSIHSTSLDAVNQKLDSCSGILLSLTDNRAEISGHPSSPNFQGLPYYKDTITVGGFMILTLKGIDPFHPLKTGGFLCLDRSSSEPWTENEKNYARETAQKINIDLYTEEQLNQHNHDKKAINQICLALQELNSVLNLQEAFTATQNTVTSLTSATVTVITLKKGDTHTIVSVTGTDPSLEGQQISKKTCLINQAMDLQRTMIPKTSPQNPVTLFSDPSPIDTCGSLLVVPLIIKDRPIGTLIAGGKPAQLFSQNQQALLEVIAGQIATRIDLARTHEQIRHMATIDGLTGLVNHRTFQNGLAKMIDRAKRQQTQVSLILCDIDHFKNVNDTYGHPFGDEVLRQVSQILKNAVRSVDLAARYGGEEFTLVLENASTEGGQKLAERIRKEIEALQLQQNGEDVHITMSFGISNYPDLATDQKTLITQADQALYRCKEGGRNQTRCY
jgi:diguanylate cyclase (GGDEF)-like protein